VVATALSLAVATTVRLVALNRDGFNSDEAVYSGQAAALAGNQEYAYLFGVFRAHPLLVHLLVSLVYRLTGVSDLAPRLVCVAAGLALVAVAGKLASATRGRLAGIVAMGFVALTPYAVIVSRQMLLDGPMALFFALAMLLLAMYVQSPSSLTLYGAAAAAGLAFLAKETAILIVPAVLVFVVLARDVRVRLRDAIVAALVYVITISPFALSLALSGSGRTAQQFFVWQIFRRANHDAAFYPTMVAPSVGIPILVLALVGMVLAARRRRAVDLVLISFTVVPFAFFELWPVKGFQYLIPLITPVAVFAADGFVAVGAVVGRTWRRFTRHAEPRWARGGVAGVVLAGSLAILLAETITVLAAPVPSLVVTDSGDELTKPVYGFLAGTGGLKPARPVGDWIRQHTLPGSRFLTIGPSFANVIQFYGLRRAQALSVSPNPLRRNPAYEPVINPDLLLRSNAIQYLVYDSYSAARTPHFTKELLGYVTKYHAELVYADYELARDRDGKLVSVPVVLIYEVHP